MPKFTSAERILVKSLVASLSIKRIPEDLIVAEIYNQTKKSLTKSGLFYVKEAIKKVTVGIKPCVKESMSIFMNLENE
jgi:hypothetical protein